MKKQVPQKFGWKPEHPDKRDHRIKFSKNAIQRTPAKISMRRLTTAVRDQGNTSSCVGQSGRELAGLIATRQGQEFSPSASFAYYCARLLEGKQYVQQDDGAYIRNVVKALSKYGVCSEDLCPFSPGKINVKPSKKAFTDALNHQGLEYARVDYTDINQIRSSLALGFPIIGGITLYSNFFPNKAGEIPMPEGSVEGGHAILFIGYDDKREMVECQNHWSDSWGDKGFFWLPYQYVTNPNLGDDFWLLRIME